MLIYWIRSEFAKLNLLKISRKSICSHAFPFKHSFNLTYFYWFSSFTRSNVDCQRTRKENKAKEPVAATLSRLQEVLKRRLQRTEALKASEMSKPMRRKPIHCGLRTGAKNCEMIKFHCSKRIVCIKGKKRRGL